MAALAYQLVRAADNAIRAQTLQQYARRDTDVSGRSARAAQETGMTEFDPANHRVVPEQRWFEDFSLGERFVIPSRTMTDAVFAAFQTASGDTHPVHYDVEYCRARGMPPCWRMASRR
jgi:hypothetical protein